MGSAGAYFVAAIVTGLTELVRVALAGTVVLVIQHWFVPVKYYSHNMYNAIQLVLEIYFQFELITALPHMEAKNGVDTTLRACTLVMLTAHWMYVMAAFLDIFVINLCGAEPHVDETGESFDELREDLMESESDEDSMAMTTTRKQNSMPTTRVHPFHQAPQQCIRPSKSLDVCQSVPKVVVRLASKSLDDCQPSLRSIPNVS